MLYGSRPSSASSYVNDSPNYFKSQHRDTGTDEFFAHGTTANLSSRPGSRAESVRDINTPLSNVFKSGATKTYNVNHNSSASYYKKRLSENSAKAKSNKGQVRANLGQARGAQSSDTHRTVDTVQSSNISRRVSSGTSQVEPSTRPLSAEVGSDHIYGRKYRRSPSYADELLFGEQLNPDWESPWGDKTKHKFVLDATDYRSKKDIKNQHKIQTQGKSIGNMGVNGRSTPLATTPKSRPNSGRPNSGRTTPSRNGVSNGRTTPSGRQTPVDPKKQMFHSSYVDESLFGPRPTSPEFEAPWSDKKGKKPLLFDSGNYHVDIKHDMDVPRALTPKVTVARKKAKDTTPRQPAWR